jgi:peptide/nickel transport system permease protein
MKTIQKNFKELLRYPSAIAGLVILLLLLGLSVYSVIAIPYQRAISLWRGGEEYWYQNPKLAGPAWLNYFTKKKLPVTIILNSANATAEKVIKPGTSSSLVTITYTFDYQYDAFPQEVTLFFTPKFINQQPFVNITWTRPDGKTIRIGEFSVGTGQTFPFSQDSKLQRRLGDQPPVEGLFGADPESADKTPLKGTYTLKIEGVTFDPGSDLDAELVVYGQLDGLAGTDHLRRDLMVALLWGTPIALAFGLVAALGTTLLTMVIAAVGSWMGGWLDEIIQRITEVNLVLPLLPVLIMVGTFYSRSIFAILGITILLTIFGGAIKTDRAIFLQVKESGYIEAAKSYGASNARIIFKYLIPSIFPILIPRLVILIPFYVFLEASLAVLGLGDPTLPTWGKIIQDGQNNGALYQGLYYWVLEPTILLTLTGLAFALLGFALDRVFNPKLRGM